MKHFFSFDPDEGFETHCTAEEARQAAEKSLKAHAEIANSDGWMEPMVKEIQWGELHVKQIVQESSRITKPPADQIDEDGFDGENNDWSEWDCILDFELRDIPKQEVSK